MRRLALALVLSVTATAAAAADSSTASLRIGVEVTRHCAVTGGAVPEVRCTRMAGVPSAPLVLTSRVPTPLSTVAPAPTSSSRVVTILF